jgi:hypothetical protein
MSSKSYDTDMYSLKRVAQLTGLPNTFRVPCPLPKEYEYDFKIFMKYMKAYPEIWNNVQRLEYIPPSA